MKSLRRQGRKIRKTRPNNNSQSCGGATGHEIVAADFAGLICLPASLDFTFVAIRFETSVRDSSAGQSANFGHFNQGKTRSHGQIPISRSRASFHASTFDFLGSNLPSSQESLTT